MEQSGRYHPFGSYGETLNNLRFDLDLNDPGSKRGWMNSNLRRVAAIAAAAVSIFTMTAATAQAGTESVNLCSESRFCMWHFADGTGYPDSSTIGRPLKCIDTAEYQLAYNRQSQAVRVWKYNNCTGDSAVVFPGAIFTPQGWTIDAISP
ncbi:peptidase inhibitor family I36 protein [Amycolatopsis sp. OK19-0408]|uniref:Peptidase inhibitor family I36 protein n=1 Tax=Amycolatopsis iheyensis TaxID=2945988 RepID=A0A9X2SNK3_9PSEU|nr:peptidase inhibitor family I36 protein [Amycolatopsis iheyensis]MCR6487166.1 peptidase inhibitor family I36 protein [Amycolatopsis iheyensis]